MKILLLGKGGQIGSQLQSSLAALGAVTALGRSAPNMCGDIGDSAGIAHTISTLRPDIIVNAAADTQVDRAETERDTAWAINATAPGVLADAAKACGALLVHYSTDYVFDGSGTRPWREDDATRPINFYGETKRAGEIAIQASGCRHLILRTSWIYGWNGRNFPQTILRIAAEGGPLRIVTDQIGAPTSARQVAELTATILRQAASRPDHDGIYHLTAAGSTSWFDYARFILLEAHRTSFPLKSMPDDIQSVTSQDYPTPARRPLNSRLDTTRLQTSFALEPLDWQTDLRRFLADRPPEPPAGLPTL